MPNQRLVESANAPAAIGPYSQAVIANGLLYTAGVIPLDPGSMEVVEGGIEAQAERVMKSLAALLEDAGSGLDRVVKTTCFLQNLGDFAAFNAVYAAYFTEAKPARSTVEVAGLPRGVLVEIEAVALVND